MFTLFFCYFRRANVFALFMVFSRANMFTLFMVLLRANMFTLFYVLFSRANVFALFFGSFTSEYVYAVLCYFSQANVFSLCLRCLWYLHERICLCCLGYFSRANVLMLFTVLSRANMFIMFCFFFKQMCLRWVICSFLLANMFSLFMAPYNMSTLLWYFLFFFFFFFISGRICLCCYVELLPANMFCAVICYFCKRIWLRWLMEFFLKLLCLRGYMEFFANAYVRAVMRSYYSCYLCYLRDLGLRDLFFILCLSCVWLNQIGVAALSVKIEALEKQVSADSVDRALVCVRQLAGRPVGLSDGTAIVAALESLADVSRSAGHVDFRRHEAILKQCRPLTHDPRLPAVVTQLLGDDESKKIAGQIQKILKSDHLFSAPQVHGSPFPAPARAPGYLHQQGSGLGRYTPYGYGSYNNNYASRGFTTTRCYNCRKTGHRIANCPALKRA